MDFSLSLSWPGCPLDAPTRQRETEDPRRNRQGRAAGAMSSSSLINFSSLEEVLKTVSEQQQAIFDTLEGMRAEVDQLALRTKLEEADNVLEDGCAATPDAAARCPCTHARPPPCQAA